MPSQTFTATGSNTFNWPDGVTSLVAEAYGDGGLGAGNAGGGGGGGAYASDTVSRSGASSDTAFVGYRFGTRGSYFRNNTTVYADYGQDGNGFGGTGGVGGLAANSVGTTKHSGGTGGASDGTGGGGGGSSGDSSGDGNNGDDASIGGAGGAAVGSGGAGGNGSSLSTGSNGTSPGGGSGGSASGNGNPQVPGDGKVILTWTAGSLVVTLQPSSIIRSRDTIHVTVEVRDAGNAVDTNASGTVTVTVSGGGNLSGTTTVSPSSGVYDFPDLSLDGTGTGLTFTFTHNGAGYTVVSNAFDLLAPLGWDIQHPPKPPARKRTTQFQHHASNIVPIVNASAPSVAGWMPQSIDRVHRKKPPAEYQAVTPTQLNPTLYTLPPLLVWNLQHPERPPLRRLKDYTSFSFTVEPISRDMMPWFQEYPTRPPRTRLPYTTHYQSHINPDPAQIILNPVTIDQIANSFTRLDPTRPPPRPRDAWFQDEGSRVYFCGSDQQDKAPSPNNSSSFHQGSDSGLAWTIAGWAPNNTYPPTPSGPAVDFTVTHTGTSKTLYINNWNFSLPETASVKGVSLTLTRFRLVFNSTIKDHTGYPALLKDYTVPTTLYPTSTPNTNAWAADNSFQNEERVVYGNGTDLWGTGGLSPSEVNNNNFAIALKIDSITNPSGDFPGYAYGVLSIYYCPNDVWFPNPEGNLGAAYPRKLLEQRRVIVFHPNDFLQVPIRQDDATIISALEMQHPVRPPPRRRTIEYTYHNVPDPTVIIVNPVPNGAYDAMQMRQPDGSRMSRPHQWTRDWSHVFSLVIDPLATLIPVETYLPHAPQPYPFKPPKKRSCFFDPYVKSPGAELIQPPQSFVHEFQQSAPPTSLGKTRPLVRPSLYQTEVDPYAYTSLYVVPSSASWHIQQPLSPPKKKLPVADHQSVASIVDPLSTFANPINFGHYQPVPAARRSRPSQYPVGTDAFITDSLAAIPTMGKWYEQHPARPPARKNTAEHLASAFTNTPSLSTTPSMGSWFVAPNPAPNRRPYFAALAQTFPTVLVLAPPADGWLSSEQLSLNQLRPQRRVTEFTSYVRHTDVTVYLPPIYNETQLAPSRYSRKRAPEYLAYVKPSDQLLVAPLISLWFHEPSPLPPKKLRNTYYGAFELLVATGGIVITPSQDEIEGRAVLNVVICGSALTQPTIGGRVVFETSILGRVNLCQPAILGRAVLAPTILGRVVMDPVLPIGCDCDIEWRDAEFQSDGSDITNSNGVTATALIKDEGGATVALSSVTASYDSANACWRATFPGTMALIEGTVYYPELNLSTTTPRTATGKRRLRRVAQYIESA